MKMFAAVLWCAWVLWADNGILGARPTHADCEAMRAGFVHNVIASGGSVKGGTVTFPEGDRVFLRCLPDTVDPRRSK